MASPIYIGVGGAAEGAALARSLGRQGLVAALVRSDVHWQVEVRSAHDGPRDFLADLGVALAAWSAGDAAVRPGKRAAA